MRCERHARRVEAAEADPGGADEQGDDRGLRARGEGQRDDHGGAEGDTYRQQASDAVAGPAEEWIDDDLHEPGCEEDGADREGAPAGVVEREGREDHQQPEEHRRQHAQPEATDEPLVAKRAVEPGKGGLLPWRGSRERGEPGEDQRGDADTREREPDSDVLGRASEREAEDRAEDGSAECGAENLAAPLTWRRHRDPGERASPGRGAGDALGESREPERERRVCGREGEARDGEDEQSGNDCPLRPEPRCGKPAGDPAEDRAGAVRADENACAGLGQVELVRVRRNEGRQRGEEQRVDEDDRADEEEETAHSLERTGATKMHRAGCVLVRPSD